MTDSPAELFTVNSASEWVHLFDQVEPWPDNPRYHPEVSIASLVDLIRELGWGAPIIVHAGDAWPVQLVAGHTRRLALRRILEADPTFVVPGAPGVGFVPARAHVVAGEDGARFATWDESEDMALGDNKVAELSSWDPDALATIMARKAGDGAADAIAAIRRRTAFDERAVRDLVRRAKAPPRRSSVPAPKAKRRPKKGEADSKPGQVYQLGPHRLFCGSSTDAHHIGALLEGDDQRPIVVCADPPYGMGKASQGVLGDNQRGEKLDAFNADWWTAWREESARNASCYIWGLEDVLWRFWLLATVRGEDGAEVRGLVNTNVTKKNLIIWKKPNAIGRKSPDMRGYPPTTERALFFMRGQQDRGNVNKDDFWEGFEDLRAWQADQCARMGWGLKETTEITGVGMFGHWTSKSQWCLIPLVHYERLATAADGKAFTRPHRELRESYQRLLDHPELVGQRQAFYAARSPFDNVHDDMTDVWEFDRVTGEERHGHATPKPVPLCERMVLSSSELGQVVAVPFGGSGPDLIACARQGRIARVMELDEGWCDVIRDRWTRWADDAGVDPGAGALRL